MADRAQELRTQALVATEITSLLGPLGPLVAAVTGNFGIGRHEQNLAKKARRAAVGLGPGASSKELRKRRKEISASAAHAALPIGGWCRNTRGELLSRKVGDQCPAGSIGMVAGEELPHQLAQEYEEQQAQVAAEITDQNAGRWIDCTRKIPKDNRHPEGDFDIQHTSVWSTPAHPAECPMGFDLSSILGAVGGLGDLLGIPAVSQVSRIVSNVTSAVKGPPRAATAPIMLEATPSFGERVPYTDYSPKELLGAAGQAIDVARGGYRVGKAISTGKGMGFADVVGYAGGLPAFGGAVRGANALFGTTPELQRSPGIRRRTMAQYGPMNNRPALPRVMGSFQDVGGKPYCFTGYKLVLDSEGNVRCVKRRHMNPFNPRALARAASRVGSFSRRVKKYVKLVHPHRNVEVNVFRHFKTAARGKKCAKPCYNGR